MTVTRTALRLATIATAIAAAGTFAVSPAAAADLPGCTVDLISDPVTISVGVKTSSPVGVFVCIDSAPGAPGALDQSVRVDAVASPTFVGQSSAGVGTADYFVGYNAQPTYTVSPTVGGSVLTVSIPVTYQVNSFGSTTPSGSSGVIVGAIPLGGCTPGQLCAATGVPNVSLQALGGTVPVLGAVPITGVGLVPAAAAGAIDVGPLASQCVLGICLLPEYVATQNTQVGELYVAGAKSPIIVPARCIYQSAPGKCP